MLHDFTKDEFDIILQAGQSNSYGCGRGPATEPFEPRGDLYYLTNDFILSRAQEEIWGNDTIGNFALPFAVRYIRDGRLASGRKLLIVRAPVGGTGFLDKRWGLQDDLFLTMMDMTRTALSLNTANRLVAFLWHQGETDAFLGASRDVHFNNLSTLLRTVRDTFGTPALPFVAGDFVPHWREANEGICRPVLQAIEDVCRTSVNARFVGTEGLLSNEQKVGIEDTIHFCRESLNELGLRYYDAYRDIVGE